MKWKCIRCDRYYYTGSLHAMTIYPLNVCRFCKLKKQDKKIEEVRK
jgi:hypothetical protein